MNLRNLECSYVIVDREFDIAGDHLIDRPNNPSMEEGEQGMIMMQPLQE
jgi:hypothetical protein